VTLADQLEVTAAALAGGCSIDRINRARRTEAPAMPDPTISSILDRLTAAHGVIDSYGFDEAEPDDADELLRDIAHEQAWCDELFATLATLAALLSDAGSEIARLHAENAGLRARSGK
jgi:ABC-type nitrate/sulfonate/bicarbonate transport system substrate-binding protein